MIPNPTKKFLKKLKNYLRAVGTPLNKNYLRIIKKKRRYLIFITF